ncbi:MAG: MarR family transcriptional regulator, partial [bacterium]|nr:MarR family transcriptional regulator [bacterium]
KDSEYTLPQLTVIAILAENGPLKATQISKMAGLANSTITGIIDRLEKKDVITRERQSTDRRLVLIKLNPGKEQIYQETRKIREDYFYDKLKELDNNKLKEMTDGLIELNNVICK